MGVLRACDDERVSTRWRNCCSVTPCQRKEKYHNVYNMVRLIVVCMCGGGGGGGGAGE
jgi:hypothetical protein